jgi:hypothetical protein
MVMKVIFLDHDGVICLSSNWGSRGKKQKEYGRKMSQSVNELPVKVRFDNFDKKAIDTLNEILEETNAEIVVSSDWKRWATVEEMGEYYESQGIKKKPIDFTPFFRDLMKDGKAPKIGEFHYQRFEDLEQERHFEILDYLKDHPEITHWVAIDDLNMGIDIVYTDGQEDQRYWGLTNFVWTPQESEGIKQSGKKEKILEFLK